jgi:hypothetical protein
MPATCQCSFGPRSPGETVCRQCHQPFGPCSCETLQPNQIGYYGTCYRCGTARRRPYCACQNRKFRGQCACGRYVPDSFDGIEEIIGTGAANGARLIWGGLLMLFAVVLIMSAFGVRP